MQDIFCSKKYDVTHSKCSAPLQLQPAPQFIFLAAINTKTCLFHSSIFSTAVPRGGGGGVVGVTALGVSPKFYQNIISLMHPLNNYYYCRYFFFDLTRSRIDRNLNPDEKAGTFLHSTSPWPSQTFDLSF